MWVEINGVRAGDVESQNPTKAKTAVTATIYSAEGEEAPYEGSEGRVQDTGGINWDKPLVDVGAYLEDGTNTIRIVNNSSITNAALAAGIIQPRGIEGMAWYGSPSIWWGSFVDYRSNGPAQAVLVPYKDVAIGE